MRRGFFVFQNQRLWRDLNRAQDELLKLAEEKQAVENALTTLESTDLAKEVELLTLKLATVEKERVAAGEETARLRAAQDNLRVRLERIPRALGVLDAMQAMYFGSGPTAAGIARIDGAASALGDAEITGLWTAAKATIDLEKRSWSGMLEGRVFSALLSQIREALRASAP